MGGATHRVLVIDDDDNIRTLVKLMCDGQGIEVIEAPDGEVGLSVAVAHRPHIILLDVNMPNRQGMDVYLDLRNHSSTSSIPVMILSAALTQRDVQMWKGLPNIVDVMTKPFDMYTLVARIHDILAARITTLA
ncbi:MAG: response regulator [Chloroflexota bacterium]